MLLRSETENESPVAALVGLAQYDLAEE
jgi:hypothetical protein